MLFCGGRPAAFAGMLHRSSNQGGPCTIMGCSRLVTLPDFQGLGLAFVLIDAIAAAFKCIGMRVRTYPAHPALIRGFAKSSRWVMTHKPGTLKAFGDTADRKGISRPCATFEWCGGAMSEKQAAFLALPSTPLAPAASPARRSLRNTLTGL